MLLIACTCGKASSCWPRWEARPAALIFLISKSMPLCSEWHRTRTLVNCPFLLPRRPRWSQSVHMAPNDPDVERARAASGEELALLLHHASTDVLRSLLNNPALDETQLCQLLNRKDISAEFLEEVARRKPLLKNYRVKRALA